MSSYCNPTLYIFTRWIKNLYVNLKGKMCRQLKLEMFFKIRFCSQREAGESV